MIVQFLVAERLRPAEVGRYTNSDGDQLVIATTMTGLTVRRTVQATIGRDRYRLMEVSRVDGAVRWVAARHQQDILVRAGETATGTGRRTTYVPGDEPRASAAACRTEHDLRAVLGDPAVLAARRRETDARTCDARSAAQQAALQADEPVPREIGPNDGASYGAGYAERGWSRAAYEAACPAAGITALTDERADELRVALGIGSYDVSTVPVETALMMTLARFRLRGIDREDAAADAAALARATDAAGDGPYSRSAFESACRAAGFAPPDDADAALIAAGGADDEQDPAPDGTGRAVAEALAERRIEGLYNEMPDHRCGSCDVWLPPGDAVAVGEGITCPECHAAVPG